MSFDIARLRLGERIAGVCAIVLFIDEFLNWYSVNLTSAQQTLASRFGVDTSASAWQAFGWVDLLMLLTILVVLAWITLAATQRKIAIPVTASTIATALCGFTTLIVLYRILNQPGPNKLVNVEYGAYLGLVLLLAMTYGAYTAMREEGGSFADAAAAARSAVETHTEPAPPPEAPAAAAPPPPPAASKPAAPAAPPAPEPSAPEPPPSAPPAAG